MGIREERENWEEQWLSPLAQLSKRTKGRLNLELPCPIRTEFQRDRDRIIHAKAFRRLKHKTQVFIAPEGDHFRTRLTHTLEVAQVARTIARALFLNEDLAEAIALGHDLGHTPFGHAGEEALNEVCPGGFRHHEQSLRVVDYLEEGKGLNLTWETRDGILNHPGSGQPATLEGQIVQLADRIAYINHDIDDALRAGIITPGSLPSASIKVLGETHRERINTMVTDVIFQSRRQEKIKMSPAVEEATQKLRDFLFRYVYIGSAAKKEVGKVKCLMKELYFYYLAHPEEIPEKMASFPREQAACDYIAGMTDSFALACFQKLFIPSGFKIF